MTTEKHRFWVSILLLLVALLVGCGQSEATATPTATASAAPIMEPAATSATPPAMTPAPSPTGTATAMPTATSMAEPVSTATATPTAEPVPTATAVPAATPTATPTATSTSVPTASPTPVAREPCDLRQKQIVSRPPGERFRGLRLSLEIETAVRGVRFHITYWNAGDETIRFESPDRIPGYWIGDAKCYEVWKTVAGLGAAYSHELRAGEVRQVTHLWNRIGSGAFPQVLPGTYRVYATFTLSPSEVYISPPQEVEVKAALQPAGPEQTEPDLRAIDLRNTVPISMVGRKLTVHRREYWAEDGSVVRGNTFFEVDLDTEEWTEVPEPERVNSPRRSCFPPTEVDVVKELAFPYLWVNETDIREAKGVVEFDLDTGEGKAYVFVGEDGERYWWDYLEVSEYSAAIAWSGDCRYAAWHIPRPCQLPRFGPTGSYLHDTKTGRAWIVPHGGTVSFWGDLLVVARYCSHREVRYWTTGYFLD